jgi:GAF domain-containing protein/HAMP domain-containing protein
MKTQTTQVKSLLERVFNRPISFRTKLVLGNMLITLFAITAMGYYVYLRAQATNNFLASQFQQSIRQKTEEKLSNTVDAQTTELNAFFQSKGRDLSFIGENIANLLSQESTLNGGIYWSAQTSLVRLANGSWDNSNNDASSIFIPAKIELNDPLISELNTIKQIELTVPLFLKANPEIVAIYFGGVSGETVYFPNIDLASIVPPDFDVTSRPWYVNASPTNNKNKGYVWSAPYQDAALHGLVVTLSTPVFDSGGRFRGVAAMDIQLNIITKIVSNIKIGETGYAFLLDKDSRLIALPQSGFNDFGVTSNTAPYGEVINDKNLSSAPKEILGLLPKVSKGESGLATVNIKGVNRLIVYRPIKEIGYGLAILVPSAELQKETTSTTSQVSIETKNTILFSIILIIGILIAASLVALGMGNILTAPLNSLIKVTEKISRGNLDASAEINSRDEIGILAGTINNMTRTLKETLSTLEVRVIERTRDLEETRQLSENRAHDLQTIAEIARSISTERDLEKLLSFITRIVSDRFGFYHVGIFLLDATGKYAVLRASNSAGGQEMLRREHRLEVGQKSIVGNVTATGQPRIALDVGADAIYFDNPNLPETRSEMALPLITRGSNIGALDVQSKVPNAFTKADIAIISLLSDQIAIALDNVRLIAEAQASLTESQSIYNEYIAETWQKKAGSGILGYHQTLSGGKAITDNQSPELNIPTMKEDGILEMPIRVRDQVIGVLNIKPVTANKHWSSEDISMVQAIVERLALALDNARLFEETATRASRERLVTEITTKIRGTNNQQEMIKTAVDELQRALGVTRVEIVPQKIAPPPER